VAGERRKLVVRFPWPKRPCWSCGYLATWRSCCPRPWRTATGPRYSAHRVSSLTYTPTIRGEYLLSRSQEMGNGVPWEMGGIRTVRSCG